MIRSVASCIPRGGSRSRRGGFQVAGGFTREGGGDVSENGVQAKTTFAHFFFGTFHASLCDTSENFSAAQLLLCDEARKCPNGVEDPNVIECFSKSSGPKPTSAEGTKDRRAFGLFALMKRDPLDCDHSAVFKDKNPPTTRLLPLAKPEIPGVTGPDNDQDQTTTTLFGRSLVLKF